MCVGRGMSGYKQVLAVKQFSQFTMSHAVFIVHYGPLMHGSMSLHLLLITPLFVMDESAQKDMEWKDMTSKQSFTDTYRIKCPPRSLAFQSK